MRKGKEWLKEKVNDLYDWRISPILPQTIRKQEVLDLINQLEEPTVSKMESVGADVSKMGNNTDCIRPAHYKGKIDRFTVWEQSYTEEECRGAYKAVIDRYVSRYDRKNGVEDLRKAEECLRRLIKWEERK